MKRATKELIVFILVGAVTGIGTSMTLERFGKATSKTPAPSAPPHFTTEAILEIARAEMGRLTLPPGDYLEQQQRQRKLEERVRKFAAWRGKDYDQLTPEKRESEMRDMVLIWGAP